MAQIRPRNSAGQLDDTRGVVAILTAVFVGILLSIISVGLMTQMVGESRQSGDFEQSQRAFYAARSGVEDAAKKIVAAAQLGQRASQPSCGSPVYLDGANQVGWTCQRILYSGSPQGKLLVPDQAVQIDTTGADPFSSVKLEWDQSQPSPVTGAYPARYYNPDLSGGFPTKGNWQAAAPVELTFVQYYNADFTNPNDNITLTNALVVPTTTAGAAGTDLGSIAGNNPLQGHCTARTNVAYHCQAIVNVPAGMGYIIRLRTRYVGTDYRLTFWQDVDAGGAQVSVPDGAATIDVTARAGAAYRRVVYKVPYKDSGLGGLNFVIYSDTDICKNFDVLVGSGQPPNGCPY